MYLGSLFHVTEKKLELAIPCVLIKTKKSGRTIIVTTTFLKLVNKFKVYNRSLEFTQDDDEDTDLK